MKNKNLILARFILVNLGGFSLFAWAYLEGWISNIIETDVTNICLVIAAVFLFSLICCFYNIVRSERDHRDIKNNKGKFCIGYRKAADKKSFADSIFKLQWPTMKSNQQLPISQLLAVGAICHSLLEQF